MAATNIVFEAEPNHLGKQLHEMQRNKEFCDAAIINNLIKIPVHSIVLAANSKQMSENFATSKIRDVHFIDISETATKSMIDYFYSGILTTTIGDANDIIRLAKLYLIPSVAEGIAEELKKKLDIDNCLRIWKIAQKWSLKELNNASCELAKKNLDQVTADQEFMRLSLDETYELLDSNQSEMTIYNSIKKWIAFDKASREIHFEKLLQLVQLQYLPDHFLQSESRIMCGSNATCIQRFLDALYMQSQIKQLKNEKKCSVIAVGDTNNTVAAVGIYLYAVGGHNGNYLRSAEKYDPTIDRWTTIQSMDTPRSALSAGNLNGKLVVAGGHSLSTVESYDDEDGTWEPMKSMNKNRSVFTLVEVPWNLAKYMLAQSTD